MTDRPRVWLGADPGVTAGAIALVNHPVYAKAFPLRGLDEAGIFNLVRSLSFDFKIQFALVEQVGIRPGDERRQGIAKLIESFAAIKTAIGANGIRMLAPIHPRSWQSKLGCANPGGDKSSSYQRAIELFPGQKVTYTTCDALLLGYLAQWEAPREGLFTEPYRPQPRSWRKFKPSEKRL